MPGCQDAWMLGCLDGWMLGRLNAWLPRCHSAMLPDVAPSLPNCCLNFNLSDFCLTFTPATSWLPLARPFQFSALNVGGGPSAPLRCKTPKNRNEKLKNPSINAPSRALQQATKLSFLIALVAPRDGGKKNAKIYFNATRVQWVIEGLRR